MTITNKNWKTTGIAVVLAFAALIGFVACNSSNNVTGPITFNPDGSINIPCPVTTCEGSYSEVWVLDANTAFTTWDGLTDEYGSDSEGGVCWWLSDGRFYIGLPGASEITLNSLAVGTYSLDPNNSGMNEGTYYSKTTGMDCDTFKTGGMVRICTNVDGTISGTFQFTVAGGSYGTDPNGPCSPDAFRFIAGYFHCVEECE